MAAPKSKTNPASTAAALANQTTKQLGRSGRFVELTSRIIPVTSALAAKLFARAHAIGALPKMGRKQLAAVLVPFRDVLAKTGLSRRIGGRSDTELFFKIREWMNEGGALEAKDIAKFVGQYQGRENYVLGKKLLEEFLVSFDELQGFLREGATSHQVLLNQVIRTGGRLVDGLGNPVKNLPRFLPPVPIRNINRTIINRQGFFQEVQFFDNGFASPSKKGGLWSLGSAQEIKTPGVAANISEQVSLREPRIAESVSMEFEVQLPSGGWRKQVVEPEQLVTVPGSLVSVGLTVQGSRSPLMDVPRSELKRILLEHSDYRIIGRGDRQRYHVVLGIPISNFRAVIRAAIRP